MSYRNVDTEAYKKAYANKKKSKNKSDKKVASGSIDQRVQTYPMRKKKYVPKFSDAQAKAKKALTSDKAYTWKFGDAFKNAKKEGKKIFTWNNKKYTTQTKEELETGKSEKERFERAAKAKEATPAKKGFFSKIATKIRGGHETQEAYETAKVARKKAKRIANLEARKAAGKSYSKKNLAALKAS